MWCPCSSGRPPPSPCRVRASRPGPPAQTWRLASGIHPGSSSRSRCWRPVPALGCSRSLIPPSSLLELRVDRWPHPLAATRWSACTIVKPSAPRWKLGTLSGRLPRPRFARRALS
jgi:hypothetical protein